MASLHLQTAIGYPQGFAYFIQISGVQGDVAFAGQSGTWIRVDSQSLELTGLNGRADFSDLSVVTGYSAGLATALGQAETGQPFASVRLIGLARAGDNEVVLDDIRLTSTRISGYELTGRNDDAGAIELSFGDYARIEVRQAEIDLAGRVQPVAAFGYDTTTNTPFTPSGSAGGVTTQSPVAETPGDQQLRVWIEGISETAGWVEVAAYQLKGETAGGAVSVSDLKLTLLENSAFALADLLAKSSGGNLTGQVVLQSYTPDGGNLPKVHAEYEFANVSFSSSERDADDGLAVYGLTLSFDSHEYTHTRYGADGSIANISTGNLIADGSKDSAPITEGNTRGLEYYVQVSGLQGDFAFGGLPGNWFKVESQLLEFAGERGRADFSDLSLHLQYSAGLAAALGQAEAGTPVASVRLIGLLRVNDDERIIEDLRLTDSRIAGYDLTGGDGDIGLITLSFDDYAKIEVRRAEIDERGDAQFAGSFGYNITTNTPFTPSGVVGNPVGVRSDAAESPGRQQARVWIDGISQTEGWIEVAGDQLTGEKTGGVFGVSALKLSLLENPAFGLADLLEKSSDGRSVSQVILQTTTQFGATPLRVHAEYEFANVSFSSSARSADDRGSLYGLSLSFAAHEYTHTRYGIDGSSTSISTGNLIADGSNDLAPTAVGQQSGLEYYLQLSGSGGDIEFSGLSGTWFRVDGQSLALTGVNGRADFSDLTVELEFSAGLTNVLRLAEDHASLASVRLIGVDIRLNQVIEELKLTGTKISAYDLAGHIDHPGLVGLAFSDYGRIEIKRAEIGPNGTVSELESFGYDITSNTPFTPSGSLGGSVGQQSQILPRAGDQQARVWIDGVSQTEGWIEVVSYRLNGEAAGGVFGLSDLKLTLRENVAFALAGLLEKSSDGNLVGQLILQTYSRQAADLRIHAEHEFGNVSFSSSVRSANEFGTTYQLSVAFQSHESNIYPIGVTGSTGDAVSTGQAIAAVFDGTAGADIISGRMIANGNAGNDTITGTAADDILRGGTGQDSLNGLAGQDLMYGGEGNDSYVLDNAGDVVFEFAEGGTDTVQSALVSLAFGASPHVEVLILTGSLNLDITAGSAANTLTGNSGNNILNGGAGIDTMTGFAGRDTYVVDVAGDRVIEAAGGGIDTVQSATISVVLGSYANVENGALLGSANLSLTGTSIANVLTGNGGNNVIDGGAGADTMTGGNGDDTFAVDVAGDQVIEAVGGGNDTVRSATISLNLASYPNVENATLLGTLALNLTGNSGGNVLTGNSAVNTINGGDGADLLDGGGGADILIGGIGNDIYVVDVAGDQVTEAAKSGSDRVQSATLSLSLASYANVENAALLGSLNLDLTGDAGANVLTGNSGANVISGGGNNDTIDGGGGADTLVGGSGDDRLFVDVTGDTIIEAAASAGGGNDTVLSATISLDLTLSRYANVEHATLSGARDLNLTGNSGDNLLVGNAGRNKIDGGSGADTMSGGGGNDTYVLGPGDTIHELAGGGTDTVESLAFTVDLTAFANVENAILRGFLDLNLGGTNEGNVLTGNSGANFIVAGGGADTLDGLGGNDTLFGGFQNDIYVFRGTSQGSDRFIEEAGADGGTDTILLDSLSSIRSSVKSGNDLVVTLSNGTFRVQDHFSGKAIEFVQDATRSVVLAASNTGGDSSGIISGTNGDDLLDGRGGDDLLFGNGGEDLLVGGDGDDFLDGGEDDDRLLGGDDDDRLFGRSGQDQIFGDAGDDLLDGGADADVMLGGEGSDAYYVDNLDDIVLELAGQGEADAVFAAISLTLSDNVENLTLLGNGGLAATGNALANVLTGNSKSNALFGLDGDDTLSGGGGIDSMDGGEGSDIYYAGRDDSVHDSGVAGYDAVIATGGFALTEGDGVEDLRTISDNAVSLAGNELANRIFGNGADNTLSGLAGSDFLLGGDGEDRLIGGLGRDRLKGGADADSFIFRDGDSGNTATTFDTVVDFVTGEDKIDLQAIGSTGLSPGRYAEGSTSATGFAGAFNAATSLMEDGEHKVVFVAGANDGWLFWDTDRDFTTLEEGVRLVGLNTLAGFALTDLV
jgi:Ca2+-binding RTX toxin-like protein